MRVAEAAVSAAAGSVTQALVALSDIDLEH